MKASQPLRQNSRFSVWLFAMQNNILRLRHCVTGFGRGG